MDKKHIIQSLEEMSILLDLNGENPFKVRAFSNASRILQSLSGDFTELIKRGEITGIKGIGKGIADFLTELIETGKSVDLEDLRVSIPRELLEMLKIPGMGPKKVKTIWQKLNITSIGELEYACKENRLVDFEGFGLKSQEKILSGIDLLKKYRKKHLLPKAMSEASHIHEQIRNFPGIIRSEIAGSLRRYKETIKDIDILVSSTAPNRESIMDRFTSLDSVELVTGKGETKSSVVLKSGIPADLRIVSDEEFPYALHHFTGSKEHNVVMREQARKLGLKMNEYGLFRENGENIACADERELFKEFNMVFIPPELRENLGEIEAALASRVPPILEKEDLRGVIHVHSHHSDGTNSIAELCSYCQKMDYEYLVISDHSKAAAYANGLTEGRIEAQHREIEELNQTMDNFTILKSIECDILADGTLDFSDEILSRFDLVIASIHSGFNMTEQESTDRLIRAMQNPFVTIIGHPTGRLLLAREGYPVNMGAIIDAAAELRVVLELNANPQRLDIDWRFLKSVKETQVMVSINPDAHRLEGIDDMKFGIGIARKGWLAKENVLNCLSAPEVIEFANRRRHPVD